MNRERERINSTQVDPKVRKSPDYNKKSTAKTASQNVTSNSLKFNQMQSSLGKDIVLLHTLKFSILT